MKRPVLTHRRLAALVVLAVLVTALLPARWTVAVTRHPRSALAWVLLPVHYSLHRFSIALRGRQDIDLVRGDRDMQVFDPMHDPTIDFRTLPGTSEQVIAQYSQLWEQHKQLRAYTERLRAELAAERDLVAQIREIDRLPVRNVVFRQAMVMGMPSTSAARVLTINRGELDGIVEGQVVVNGAHLLGRIAGVGPRNGTVRLITSPGTEMIVNIVPPYADAAPRHEQAIIRASDDGTAFLARVDSGAAIKRNDLVHLADNQWPIEVHGMLVGRVEDVLGDEQTPIIRKRLVIRPMLNVERVGHVLVIIPQPIVQEPAGPGR